MWCKVASLRPQLDIQALRTSKILWQLRLACKLLKGLCSVQEAAAWTPSDIGTCTSESLPTTHMKNRKNPIAKSVSRKARYDEEEKAPFTSLSLPSSMIAKPNHKASVMINKVRQRGEGAIRSAVSAVVNDSNFFSPP